MSLDCPRCPEALLVERRVPPTGGGAPVDVYLCEGCRGVWLDGQTLATICPTLSHLPEHRDEIALVGKRGAGIEVCVRCGVPPFEYRVLGVDIDFCLRCSGVWLDGDEYEEAMLGGADPVPDAARGGPYRRAASSLATGEIKCAYCGHSTDPKKTYVRELGPACSACHFQLEQRTAHLRATDTQVDAPGLRLLEDLVSGLGARLGWSRQR
jgi:Zn-finger nucleic acid-binding protein